MSITQVVARITPEVVTLAKSALEFLSSKGISNVVEAVKDGTGEAVATLTSDGNVARAIVNARSSFVTKLNGLLDFVPGEKRQYLEDVIDFLSNNTHDLTEENKTNLTDLIQDVISRGGTPDEVVRPSVSSTGPSATPQVSQAAANATEREIEARIQKGIEEGLQKRLQQMGLTGDGIPQDPIDRILKGVSGIAVGELRNMNSPLGWGIRLYGRITGKQFTRESVNTFLNKFIDGKFRNRLVGLLESTTAGNKVPDSVWEGLGVGEKTALQWVGRIVKFGSYAPDWLFDAVAASGELVDASAEMLHHVPVLGNILKIPFLRYAYSRSAAFLGRFTNDIELIASGTKELKTKFQPTAAVT